MDYSDPPRLTPVTAAPGVRQEMAPAELASWQHGQDEAVLVTAQLGIDDHSAAILAGPEGHSVAFGVDRRIPPSPGLQPSMGDPGTSEGQGT